MGFLRGNWRRTYNPNERMIYQNLICIGGGSHGIRVDAPDDVEYVNVADPRQHRVRQRADVLDLQDMWAYSSYRRGWVKSGRHGQRQPALFEQSLSHEQSDKLVQQLAQEGKLP